jgi:peptidoglycan hydrolase-like protein with peptidoglycan-binding domain
MGFRIRMASVALGLALSATVLGATAGTAQAAVGAPQIVEGDQGFNVYCVQWAANWFLDPQPPHQPIADDGSFGPATLAEVKWFQEQQRLAQDGQVGPDTGSALWGVINGYLSNGDPNFTTPWGVPISNCYQVLPTHS